mmetsp:Transcript_16285/g.51162  ORF Transcript_16285/g.51162 Transcript_16285/m.51162 type:complete len:293 (-) Transcript_16285:1010-1888(-)
MWTIALAGLFVPPAALHSRHRWERRDPLRALRARTAPLGACLQPERQRHVRPLRHCRSPCPPMHSRHGPPRLHPAREPCLWHLLGAARARPGRRRCRWCRHAAGPPQERQHRARTARSPRRGACTSGRQRSKSLRPKSCRRTAPRSPSKHRRAAAPAGTPSGARCGPCRPSLRCNRLCHSNPCLRTSATRPRTSRPSLACCSRTAWASSTTLVVRGPVLQAPSCSSPELPRMSRCISQASCRTWPRPSTCHLRRPALGKSCCPRPPALRRRCLGCVDPKHCTRRSRTSLRRV